jgi:hypothetical protein
VAARRPNSSPPHRRPTSRCSWAPASRRRRAVRRRCAAAIAKPSRVGCGSVGAGDGRDGIERGAQINDRLATRVAAEAAPDETSDIGTFSEHRARPCVQRGALLAYRIAMFPSPFALPARGKLRTRALASQRRTSSSRADASAPQGWSAHPARAIAQRGDSHEWCDRDRGRAKRGIGHQRPIAMETLERVRL